jgi:tetratricopeptide (TPR) repeat protein
VQRRILLKLAQILEGSLFLLVLGSAAAIGAVHPWSVTATAGVALGFAALIAFNSDRDSIGVGPPLLFWAFLLAATWAVVQCLPMGGLVDLFSEETAKNWALSGADTTRFTGNLVATQLMALKCIGAAALFWAAWRYFHSGERVNSLTVLIVVSGAMVAVLALAQAWLQSDGVLFIYEPQMGPVRPGLRGPFVNPDHFGAYMAVSGVLALGRGIGSRLYPVRYAYYGVFVVLFVCLVLSLSISALFAFTIGFALMAILWKRQDIRIADAGEISVLLLGLGFGVSLVALYVGFVPNLKVGVWAQLEDWSRVPEIWAASFDVAASAPFTGVGSGSLADLLGSRLDAPALSAQFARNQPLQSMVDFGIPIGALLLVSLGSAMRITFIRWPSEHAPLLLPIAGSLWVLAILGLVDFSLEIPAIGIPGILLLGALSRQGIRYRRRRGRFHRLSGFIESLSRRRGAKALFLIVGAMSVGLIGAGSITGQSDLADARERLWAAASEVPEEPAALSLLVEAGRDVLAMRPGEGRIYTLVGAGYLAAGELETALLWFENARRLLPNDSPTLRLVAVAQLRTGDIEAGVATMLEALESDPWNIRLAMVDLAGATADPEIWARVAISDESRGELTEELLRSERYLETLSWASVLFREDADGRVALEAATSAALALGASEQSRRFAGRLLELFPESAPGTMTMARLERDAGDLAAARERLERALSRREDTDLLFALWECLLDQLRYGEESVSDTQERVRDVRNQVRPIALSDPVHEVRFHRLSIRYYTITGQWRAVASAAELGLRSRPGDPEFRETLRRARIELGELEESEDARRAEMGSAEMGSGQGTGDTLEGEGSGTGVSP